MEPEAAYVVNKQYISVCLKTFCTGDNNCDNSTTQENINLLTYVGIHELSHIMSNEIGHGDEFKQNFHFLLDHSKKINFYDKILRKTTPLYIDLSKLKTPSKYCGVSIINSIT